MEPTSLKILLDLECARPLVSRFCNVSGGFLERLNKRDQYSAIIALIRWHSAHVQSIMVTLSRFPISFLALQE